MAKTSMRVSSCCKLNVVWASIDQSRSSLSRHHKFMFEELYEINWYVSFGVMRKQKNCTFNHGDGMLGVGSDSKCELSRGIHVASLKKPLNFCLDASTTDPRKAQRSAPHT